MTKDRRSYVYSDGKDYYCLMSKLPGRHIDPFIGDCIKNGRKLGNIVATLHMALKKIESPFEYYDADIIMELKGWIAHEIKESNLNISQEIIDTCYEFEKLYSRLPRQLIHRDIHTGNLLFEDDSFIGYLDFDISQRNVRIFDICYLGAGLLVENYLEAERLCQWQEIFGGILEGYEEMSELSSDERQAIPMMFIIIELIFAAYFSKIGQVEVSKSCINMINWLYDNLDRIEDVINAR
jgi:Ser/Thr protein kinase RdoA (MazF antagonist)